MACHVLFLDFEKTDYDISDEFLAAGYGQKEIIDLNSTDPSSVDPSLRDLMITNFKLVNVTNELIIAYNPSSSMCRGDSGNFDKFIYLCKVF